VATHKEGDGKENATFVKPRDGVGTFCGQSFDGVSMASWSL
jgi:hypothetical protein